MKPKAFVLLILAFAMGTALAAPDSLACRMVDWLDVEGTTCNFGSDGEGNYTYWGTYLWDMAMGDSFLVWLPGTDIYYLINPFSQTEVETTFSKDFGSVNAKGVCVKDSITYIVGGGGVCSFRFRNDSLFLAGFNYTAWASFHYAVIRDTFLYTAALPGSFGLYCINIANPESLYVVWSTPSFFGYCGMEVIDSFVYTFGCRKEDLEPPARTHLRPQRLTEIVRTIDDTVGVGDSMLFIDNIFHGDIASNGEYIFHVYSEMSDFILGVQDYTLGDSYLDVWGEDYSYTWSDYDSEGVFGVEVLNDTILAVGFEHGFSIIDYTQLAGMTEVAYYRDTDSIYCFTHFARKGNRMYALAHPREGICRMYMFELDSTIWTGISDPSPQTALPHTFAISAYPNPFNSAVTIAIEGAGVCDTPLRVEIFDVNGRRVSVIGNYDQPVIARRASPDEAISYGCEKDCFGQSPRNDNAGEVVWRPDESLPSGVYLVRASAGGRGDLDPTGTVATARVVYLK